MWRWELNSPHLHFSEAKVFKKVSSERNELSLASSQIKLLSKLVESIESASNAKDLAALSVTNSKYLKAVQKSDEA